MAIAVFGAVENGRRRMRTQKMHDKSRGPAARRHFNRNVPVTLGRQPKRGKILGVVVGLVRFRIDRQKRAGHIAPEKLLKTANVLAVDWKLAQHEHTVLTFVLAEADRIIRLVLLSIVIEVAAARPTGVHWPGEKMIKLNRLTTVLSNRQVFGSKQLGRSLRYVVVELVHE